jgi:hypothetical protein
MDSERREREREREITGGRKWDEEKEEQSRSELAAHLESTHCHVLCNPETTPSWEPILSTLAKGPNGPAQVESIGRADGGGRGHVTAHPARARRRGEGGDDF